MQIHFRTWLQSTEWRFRMTRLSWTRRIWRQWRCCTTKYGNSTSNRESTLTTNSSKSLTRRWEGQWASWTRFWKGSRMKSRWVPRFCTVNTSSIKFARPKWTISSILQIKPMAKSWIKSTIKISKLLTSLTRCSTSPLRSKMSSRWLSRISAVITLSYIPNSPLFRNR